MIPRPVWTDDELSEAAATAVGIFRQERVVEPLERYGETFDEYQGYFEDLLESTVDLADLTEQAHEVLSNKDLLDALRYLSGPPISLDDLLVVSDVTSVSPKALSENPGISLRVIQTVVATLDRRRFPWVVEGREPTEAERSAAVVASAALAASQRVGTMRRNEGKEQQEQAVVDALKDAGLTEVRARDISTLALAPRRGEFCRESLLGSRKADLVVRLWDDRIMAIECKVSNSYTNSIKRLNNDAAVKAVSWVHDFGTLNIVPSAVLSGTYKLAKLVEAQSRGLAIFWAHDLKRLTDWIDATAKRAS